MVIGLTGGIASGKSTVSNILRELGAFIIDADAIAREVVAPGSPVLQKIVERFGPKVIQADGTLYRQRLGEIIFSDAEARKDLNRIIHPAIRKEMMVRRDVAIVNGEDLIVLDIPLLFESELEYMIDKVLVVYVPYAIQLERLMQRDGIDEALAIKKISSQIPLEEKKELGNAYIDNSKSVEETRAQLTKLIVKWRQE
jgi:dephospho-CoA kinase